MGDARRPAETRASQSRARRPESRAANCS